MKKALVVVAAIALIVWVISWFRTPEAVATSAARPWPAGMGTLDSVAGRFPPLHANAAAVKLTALAKALPKNEAADEFVRREIARGELTIGGSPAIADVSAIRELLLREPIVWERHDGIGGNDETEAMRALQLTVARALVASALTKARANDPAALEDLHAAWKLARSLDGHPQMMTQTSALTTARMINAVAWKMPLPAPAWLVELQARDNIRPLLEAFQYSAASYANDGSRIFPTKMLADSVDRDRGIAEALINETRCDVNAPANELGVDVTSVWRRAFRYRAEREATANALRVREGKPIESTSRCSDGAWTFDGTTLRFSHEITTPAPDRPMPLVLRVKP
ncbi:MAG TPA: hypothetical protein VGQ65_17970 [Thermoanaerobaculia bacterium]|jgi:hypothetical protein|nr:hypothetical protein [Thermoanaerobaculia bacterium]